MTSRIIVTNEYSTYQQGIIIFFLFSIHLSTQPLRIDAFNGSLAIIFLMDGFVCVCESCAQEVTFAPFVLLLLLIQHKNATTKPSDTRVHLTRTHAFKSPRLYGVEM